VARLQIPASYTARKRIVLGGTVYNPGDVIPNATVKGLKHLSSLLSNRSIVPNVDLWRRTKTRLRYGQPTDVSPVVRRAL
jgi:hypothetical protein